ncbi:MAG: hypothetical protein KBD78_14690 [Oligoflexales bacterium]|nr:hypothetical protein [Oligoflexales bacterium]
MTVIKRTAKNSSSDLVTALGTFIEFLRDMGENDAADDLEEAMGSLEEEDVQSADYRQALETIIDAFEGDHELAAYTFHRDTSEWTEKEELAQISSRVLSLAKRLLK